MISILGDDDPDIVICVSEFGEITGTIESKPELPAECWQAPLSEEGGRIAFEKLKRFIESPRG